jgi:dephospho-CoA kinase
MSFTVGLTGGIGSGKSTVAELFAELGVPVIDTDAIAHELTAARGAAMPAIRAAFGGEVAGADGALDRRKMRELVFADPDAKRRLEAILHPLIRSESEARCRAKSDAPYVLLVVPLLVETAAYRGRVDRTLVVDCDEALQVARVIARGLSVAEVRAIMATQATREQRLAAADDVVLNDGGLEELDALVTLLHKRYLALSAETNASRGDANG